MGCLGLLTKSVGLVAEPIPEDTVSLVPEALVVRFQTQLDTGCPATVRTRRQEYIVAEQASDAETPSAPPASAAAGCRQLLQWP